MNIAVVDDCKSFVDEFCTLIKNYCNENNIEYKTKRPYKTNFQSDILLYIAIICGGMIAVTVTVLFMMINISKTEVIKTGL